MADEKPDAVKKKRRRGRPTVLRAYCGDNDDLYTDLSCMIPSGSSRKAANNFYCYQIFADLMVAASEIDYYNLIVPEGHPFKAGILEQLGRMKYQDGYSDQAVIREASIAGKLLHDGVSCKGVVRYIRQDRMNGYIKDY